MMPIGVRSKPAGVIKHVPAGTLSCYYDPHFARDVVKIKPGEFFATTRPYIIATVLGSCVAACIRDVARGSAGMNHFMLPERDPEAVSDGGALRYGSFAMESLINEFIKHGSARRDLEAKIFGGASVVESIQADVGAQNAAFAVDYLAGEEIRTTVTDLGGSAPRKVLFFVEDGRALVKYLWQRTDDKLERREADYARTLAAAPATSAVDLF